jgi:hypothetical protein
LIRSELRVTGSAVAQPLDQIRDVRELLLEVALVLLQPLEDALTVVPAVPDAVVASKAALSMSSSVHGHLLSPDRNLA